MDRQIRRVALVVTLGFLAVFGQLNYVQIFAAGEIASNPANRRHLLREYAIKRGDILTLDGVTIARSVRTRDRKDPLKYVRTYPQGELYGHITGYYSILYGKTRIESSYDERLLGRGGVLTMQEVGDRLFGEEDQGDDVRLTIHSGLQETARATLGDQRGAIVALDPSTGEIRALWSYPSYDPNPLASHEGKVQRAAISKLKPNSLRTPMLDLTTSARYAPGSTFKVLTGAAALENGYDPSSTFPDPEVLDLPLTDQGLRNFTRTACTGGGRIDLFTALQVSCDTTFALLGLKLHDQLRRTAEAFGFNTELPFDVGAAQSVFPDIPDDEAPFRAFAGIGQGDVAATPLQMALVAAGVANGGEVPRPRLVREVLDPEAGSDPVEPEMLGRAMSAQNARRLTEMMVAVVEGGTGTAAQIEGVRVAGKTGTSQTGVQGEAPHTWFIAFAPAEAPRLAVAVIVENGGAFGSEATGGRVAAPLAKAILEADRRIRGW